MSIFRKQVNGRRQLTVFFGNMSLAILRKTKKWNRDKTQLPISKREN